MGCPASRRGVGAALGAEADAAMEAEAGAALGAEAGAAGWDEQATSSQPETMTVTERATRRMSHSSSPAHRRGARTGVGAPFCPGLVCDRRVRRGTALRQEAGGPSGRAERCDSGQSGSAKRLNSGGSAGMTVRARSPAAGDREPGPATGAAASQQARISSPWSGLRFRSSPQ